jgi:hypothetical protein
MQRLLKTPSSIKKKKIGCNLFPLSCLIHTNLFFVRFTLSLVESGDLIPRTLSLKEIFSYNVEIDVPILLTML